MSTEIGFSFKDVSFAVVPYPACHSAPWIENHKFNKKVPVVKTLHFYNTKDFYSLSDLPLFEL